MGKKNDGSGNRGGGHHHGSQPPDAPAGRTPSITDGTSNTIIVGEEGALFLPCASEHHHGGRAGAGTSFGDGSVRTIGGGGNIADGTSNTLLLGETAARSGGGRPAGGGTSIGDGSVRTVAGISTSFGDGSVRTVGGGGNIVDGTSNTIVVGETGGGAVPLPGSVHRELCRHVDPAYLMRVRVHTGRLRCDGFPGQPLAYIRGTDIYFAPGRYDPHSESGRDLLKRVLMLGARHYGPGRRFAVGFRRNHEIEA